MRDSTVKFDYLACPLGPLLLVGSDKMVERIGFPAQQAKAFHHGTWKRARNGFPQASRQLLQYFSGERTEFDIAVGLKGNTFQRAVWKAIAEIPYGETRTYGDIARSIGEPVTASRAVGAACGENPVPLIVPCHRVVGVGGALVGFGGGLAIKRFLLDLEFRVKPPAGTLFAVA